MPLIGARSDLGYDVEEKLVGIEADCFRQLPLQLFQRSLSSAGHRLVRAEMHFLQAKFPVDGRQDHRQLGHTTIGIGHNPGAGSQQISIDFGDNYRHFCQHPEGAAVVDTHHSPGSGHRDPPATDIAGDAKKAQVHSRKEFLIQFNDCLLP
jgi:hypothetical protein